MSDSEETPKPRTRRRPAAEGAEKPKAARKPRARKSDAPEATTAGASAPDKVEKLAEEAVEAGRKLLETETGRKVADAADSAFARAEQVSKQALQSDFGKQATETAKKVWQTELGRNVAIGAGAGAALGSVVPFVGTIIGAVVGGGLGYLRVISRKG